MSAFEQLHEQAKAAVIDGTNRCEPGLVDGSPRWGVSVVFRPSVEVRRSLQALTAEALTIIGGTHWPTGNDQTIHVTVRALDTHRSAPDPAAIRRFAAAMRAAAAQSKPATFTAVGVALATGSLMCAIEPDDAAADDFAAALASALGDDGFYEADFTRTIWYANLIHFAEPVRNGAALVDWASARRHRHFGTWTSTDVRLAQWRFDGRQAVPTFLATERLA